MPATSLTLTATQRLARELNERYQQQQLEQGQQAWQAPEIITSSQWFQQLWRQQLSQYDSRTLLNGIQMRALWRAIISNDIKQHFPQDYSLWNLTQTTESALTAWYVLRQYRINLKQCSASPLPDHQCFVRWCEVFLERCQQHNWLDQHSLLAEINTQVRNGKLAIASRIELQGFDSITPLFAELLMSCAKQGSELLISPHLRAQLPEQLAQTFADLDIDSNQDSTENFFDEHIDSRDFNPVAEQATLLQTQAAANDAANITTNSYQSSRQQWLAAAQWASAWLAREPNAKLAIVSSNLAQSRADIEWALGQTLGSTQRRAGSTTLHWHTSLGLPLSSHNVVRHGLLLLQWLIHWQVEYQQISEWLRSPFISDARQQQSQRQVLDWNLRDKLDATMRVDALCDIIVDEDQQATFSELVKQLQAQRQQLQEQPKQASMASWGQFCINVLKAFGWPGDGSLQSHEYQACQAFISTFDDYNSSALITSDCDFRSYLSGLQRHCQQQLFQPQSGATNIDVMGILEASGITFDGIWFGDLSQSMWPGNPKPSPFIAIALQNAAGYEGANSERNNQTARGVQQRLGLACQELILSHAKYDGDLPLLPSPLLQHHSISHEDTLEIPTLAQSESMQYTKAMENYIDDQGLPLSIDEFAVGSSLFTLMSASPFTAYARYRLLANYTPPPQPGKDAQLRGQLLHLACDFCWTSITQQRQLQALNDEQRQELVDSACRRAFAQLHNKPLQRYYDISQHNWATRVLNQWLEIELSRDRTFTVAHREYPCELSLSPLKIRLRIDRIDRLQDGSIIIIDYKTGSVVDNPNQWHPADLSAPQIPLYAVTLLAQPTPPKIAALAIAQLQAGDCLWQGLSADTELQGKAAGHKVQAVTQHRAYADEFTDWQQLETAWQSELNHIAQAFIEGQANVGDCTGSHWRFSPYASLARIYDEQPSTLLREQ